MASLTITNTFVAGTKAASTDVNTNFTDVSTYVNDRNSGAADWDTVSCAGTITAKGQLIGKGTITNDNAAALDIGEYIEALVSGVTVPGASGVFGDLTSISLTAGDWDVSANTYLAVGGGTVTGPWQVAISVNSAATTSDQVLGSNHVVNDFTPGLAGSAQQDVPINNYRLSLSGTTTIFFKLASTYSVGPTAISGRISARRVR